MRCPIFTCVAMAATVVFCAETRAVAADESSAALRTPPIASTPAEAALHAKDTSSRRLLLKPHLFALRLGVSFQNRVGGAFGIDITPPRLNLAPDLSTRFTLEGITFTRSTPSLSDVVPIGAFTLDQVYRRAAGGGTRPYVGAGIGFYAGALGARTSDTFLGPLYRDGIVLGEKLFVGADFSTTTGLEASVHFVGSQTLGTLQLRLKL